VFPVEAMSGDASGSPIETEPEEEVVIEEVPPEKDIAPGEVQEDVNKADGKDDEDEDDPPLPEDASPQDIEIAKIEKEKKKMDATQKLERSLLWKIEGNKFFKAGEMPKAGDAYYHAIIYCRELTHNPQYYPKYGHNEEQRKIAQDMCENVYTNLSLVQLKYAASLGAGNEELQKVLEEAVKSASEALKINGKNVKALFRRAQAKEKMAELDKANAEAQVILGEAKTDLLAVLEEDKQNRDARVQLKAIQDKLKALKKQEVEFEKKTFSFGNTLSGLGVKEKDLLGDGTIKKKLETAGDGGKWVNEDWLVKDAPIKCVVHLQCTMLQPKQEKPVTISFVLGEKDMHEGFSTAVKSMTVGEVSHFTFAAQRLSANTVLSSVLPKASGESTWELKFLKFVTWHDLERNCEHLLKVHEEGWGRKPENLSEVFIHWRVFGPDGSMIHSSRNTVDLGDGTGGGFKQVEDEDKEPPRYVLGENCWEPLELLCKSLKQGGVAELRARKLPPLPKQDEQADATSNAAAQLSMMMNKFKSKDKEDKDLYHCTIRAELERVIPALVGPEDPRWEGVTAIAQECYLGQQCLDRGYEQAALARFRRVLSWVDHIASSSSSSTDEISRANRQAAAARASIGWVLVSRAAPILDSGNVRSDILKAAQKDIAEAEENWRWLNEHFPDHAGTKLLKAKILVAQDDDFKGAYDELILAQEADPGNNRVQEELKLVKIELRKEEEQRNKAKVAEIRDNLKRVRENGCNNEEMASLLSDLQQTSVTWETVMETRIGVEVKNCQEAGNDNVKRLCTQILGKLKDESKEQRPMWES